MYLRRQRARLDCSTITHSKKSPRIVLSFALLAPTPPPPPTPNTRQSPQSLRVHRLLSHSVGCCNCLLCVARAHPFAGLSKTFLTTAGAAREIAVGTAPGGSCNPPRGITFAGGIAGGRGLLCGTTVPGGSGGGGGGAGPPTPSGTAAYPTPAGIGGAAGIPPGTAVAVACCPKPPPTIPDALLAGMGGGATLALGTTVPWGKGGGGGMPAMMFQHLGLKATVAAYSKK